MHKILWSAGRMAAMAAMVAMACVWPSTAVAKAPAGRYSYDADTVSDSTTKLVWQRVTFPATTAWTQAFTYCDGLDLGGKQDWRLPNIRELASIVDLGESGTAIDPTAFPGTKPASYWSLTDNVGAAGLYFGVDFATGKVMAAMFGSMAHYSRCVRGP